MDSFDMPVSLTKTDRKIEELERRVASLEAMLIDLGSQPYATGSPLAKWAGEKLK